MTPEDVAAIRAIHERERDGSCMYCEVASPCHSLALCDALEEAWAKRDKWRRVVIEEARSHLDDIRLLQKAEATLARVRALCDEAAPPNQCRYADDGTDCESHCDCGWGTLWHDFVRAALDGGDQ